MYTSIVSYFRFGLPWFDDFALLNESSVTRFGEISPIGQTFKDLRQTLRVCLVFGKILNLLWHFFIKNWGNLNHCK